MKRTVLFLAFAAAGIGVLIWLAGGFLGARVTRPEPEIEGAARPRGARLDVGDQIPGAQVTAATGIDLTETLPPETWTDPQTGANVRLPGRRGWWFQADSFEPVAGEEETSGRFRKVRLRTFRAPKTLEEARALAAGEDPPVKLVVTADEARSESLSRKMSTQGETKDYPDGAIRLLGHVRIADDERGLVIDGAEVSVDPGRETATGEGEFTITHEAFVIKGKGLSLRRDAEHDRDEVEILRDAWIHLAGGMRGARGMPLDVTQGDKCPCEVAGGGGAVVVRDTRGTTDHLRIDIAGRVRADQEGGRHLEADRLTLYASRPLGQRPGETIAGEQDWTMDRLEGDGEVLVNFPAERSNAEAVLVALQGRSLSAEAVDGRLRVMVLHGNPVGWMDGDVPLEGVEREGEADGGRLRLSARDELWVRPAPAADVPAGADPSEFWRLELRGAGRIEREESGASPQRDVLEGETISLLVASRKPPPPAPGASAAPQRALAVAFAAEGNVRLGGTRLTGAAERLVVTGLDGETPRLVVEGRGTSLGVTDLERSQGLLGPDGSSAPTEDPAGGGDAPGARGRGTWIVERLQARGGVDVLTSLGGPAVGLAAHVQGDAAAYDRTSDRARLSRGPAGPARIATLAPDGAEDDVLEATFVEVERAKGRVRAGGGVNAHVVSLGAEAGAAEVPLGTGRARAASLGIVVDGRIEMTFRRQGTTFAAPEGAEQTVRVEGPLQVEVRAGEGPVDRLRAEYLEVVLVRAVAAPPGTPASPVARAARPPATGAPSGRRPAPGPKRTPWDVKASELVVGLEGSRVGTLEATGEVSLEGADGTVRGDALSYDARTRRVAARGRGGTRAEATFGEPGARSRLAAPEISMLSDAAGAAELRARGPASALIHRADPRSPGRVERYAVASSGDIVVVRDAVTAVGWVEIRREARDGPQAPWGSPWTLWSESVRIEGSNLLAREAAVVRRFVAEGPRTTFVTAPGPEQTSVWGDRFEIDVATERATISGTPGRPVVLRRGNDPDKRIDADQETIVLSTRTGDVISVHGSRVVMPRER